MQNQPRIAIIGGGPAGLTLGAFLHKQNIPFTIFELRSKPSDDLLREPSGMLDLHEDTGLAAVRACGLYEAFAALPVECAQDSVIIRATDGAITHSDTGSPDDRPEIARNTLVHMLRSAVPPSSIQWNHKLLSARHVSNTSSKVALDFGSEHGVHEFDFVVGADGAWSKIRPLVTDVQPHYGGFYYTTLRAADATNRFPDLAEMVGRGTCSILGSRNGLITHRGVNGSIVMYVCISGQDEHGLDEKTTNITPKQFQDIALSDSSLYASWDPKFKQLLRTVSDEEAAFTGPNAPTVKPMYMLPIGNSWPSTAGVTLIGDAAHLMMPWAGEGVNAAMRDALNLGEAIVKAYKGVDETASTSVYQSTMQSTVAEFEQDMFARCQEVAQETWDNSKILFSDDGAKDFADLMASFGPPPE